MKPDNVQAGQAPVISTPSRDDAEIPGVRHVFIEDPQCQFEETCENVAFAVNNGQAQDALWRYDSDRNHIFDQTDFVRQITSSPSWRVADMYVGAYQQAGEWNTITPEQIVSLVSALAAARKSAALVEWLDALPGRHTVDARPKRHNYPAAVWNDRIMPKLGLQGAGYAEQITAAAIAFQDLLASDLVSTAQSRHIRGGAIDGYSYVLDLTNTPPELKPHLVSVAQYMATTFAFASRGKIACEGSGCFSDDESPEPYSPAAQTGFCVALLEESQAPILILSNPAFDCQYR